MLTRLVLKNFKAIGDPGIDLELKPLTILMGPNGSGKSSVLEAIGLLNANAGRHDITLQGELVRFSSLEEIAHKHELSRWMTWEIHLSQGPGMRWEHRPDSGEEKQTLIRDGQDWLQLMLEGDRRTGHTLRRRRVGQPSGPEQGNTSFRKFDGAQLEYLSRGTADQMDFREAVPLVNQVGSWLKERVFLLSSLRGEVPVQAGTGEIPRWVGSKGQGLVPLLSLISNSRIHENTWNSILGWAEHFALSRLSAGLRAANTVAADYMDAELKTIVNLALAGAGSRQVLSIITQLFWSQPDSLIMIEEPELSLHPEGQAALCELFAEALQQEKQIMASTHSRYLLLALGKVVRKKKIRADDIAVYHVTKGEQGTIATRSPLSKRGYPLGWPPSLDKVEKDIAREWAKGAGR